MRVVELWRFPVKSFAGEQLERVAVDELGLAGDRQWGVLDMGTSKMLTARREPSLLFATARVTDDGALDARLPDGSVATDDSLSDWLGRPVRLVQAGGELEPVYENPLDADNDADWVEWTGPSNVFHDSKGTRFSLVSRATTGDWDQRRFRTNVIVDAGGENDLVGRTIRVGDVEAQVIKLVTRCVMTTRPQPGLERDLGVLKTINKERNGTLAIGCVVTTPGVIAIGDEVVALD